MTAEFPMTTGPLMSSMVGFFFSLFFFSLLSIPPTAAKVDEEEGEGVGLPLGRVVMD